LDPGSGEKEDGPSSAVPLHILLPDVRSTAKNMEKRVLLEKRNYNEAFGALVKGRNIGRKIHLQMKIGLDL